MTAPDVLVFGSDLVHQGEVARCERLVAACQSLWPGSTAGLLVGHRSPELPVWDGVGAAPACTRQDGAPVLHALLAQRQRDPRLNLVFSANDGFSRHVARLFCAQTGSALLGRVFGASAGRAACGRTDGSRFDAPLGAGQVLLVDERYFLRCAPDPSRVGFAGAVSGPARPMPFTDSEVTGASVPLHEAELVLSAGDGVTDWDSFAAVAQLLGATVGGSKVVCDKGLLPRDRQVGSSGSAVAPRVYLALGISGSTQHLQGIAESASILAVNTDANAAIVRRAALAIITDANALLRCLRDDLAGAEA